MLYIANTASLTLNEKFEVMHKLGKSALILGALFLIFTGCHKVPTPGGDHNGESTFVRVKETPRTWDGNTRAGNTYQLLDY